MITDASLGFMQMLWSCYFNPALTAGWVVENPVVKFDYTWCLETVTAVCNSGHLRVRQSPFCSVLCTLWPRGKSLCRSCLLFHCLLSLQLTQSLFVSVSPCKWGLRSVLMLQWKWMGAVMVCRGSGFMKGKKRGICLQSFSTNQHTSSDS